MALSWICMSASVISGIGARKKRMRSRPTKPATPRYTPLDVLETVDGVNGVGEEDAAGQQGSYERADALDGLGEVEDGSRSSGAGRRWRGRGRQPSRESKRPAPTTNMLPQKPPKDCLRPEGQKSRQPTARTARPVMKVTRKPNLRRIHPEMVQGDR